MIVRPERAGDERAIAELTAAAFADMPFNAVCREEAARAGAHWIDIAPVSRARGGEAGMLVDDGLHPSAAMYALWTAQALPAARQALGR